MVCPEEILAGGYPLFRPFSKIGPQLTETERGFLGGKMKKDFFGKNMFKVYKKPICALTIEWETKQSSILDAVTPILHIDNWKKLAKNTKKGPPEVIGNVISGVEVGAIPIKTPLSNTPNSVLQ